MGKDRSFLEQFDVQFEKINIELEKTFKSQVPIVKEILSHSLLSEGKRLRPLLFLLSCRLCGYDEENAYRLSTIFECIHAASLLHDDVLDNAEVRRQKPSAKNVWGNLAAVLGGDYMYAAATTIAVSCKNTQLYKVLSETTTRMVEGQFLELANTHNWQVSRDEYMEIIISKTAALISAACASGAIIAGAGREAAEKLGGFGLKLGIAFQLMDDILDYTSNQEDFGKPVGKDLREGKITLPLIYTLSDVDKSEVKRLEGEFKNGRASEVDYKKLIGKVRINGAIERVITEARFFVDEAAGYLEYFPSSPIKESLIALNTYMVERNF
jgi:octaprenyl-diphosphate synthase